METRVRVRQDDSSPTDASPTDTPSPSATSVPSNGPDDYTYLGPFFISLFPSGTGTTDDNFNYLTSVLLNPKATKYYISSSGAVIKNKIEGRLTAAQFVIVNPDDEALLATWDPDTQLPDEYYGEKSTTITQFNKTDVRFRYTYAELNGDDTDVTGEFSVEYKDTALFPFARTVQFYNTQFATCGNEAVFCAFRKGVSFTSKKDVEAFANEDLQQGCGKVYLVAECVTPNCFNEDTLAQCFADYGGAAASSTVPAVGTPAAGTPAAGTPAQETPAQGTPAQGTPAQGTPAAGTPAADS